MTRYAFVRDPETGKTGMKMLDKRTFKTEELPKEPAVEGPELTTVFRCTVPECGKDFAIVALAAKHFRKEHEELFEDKDSWRPFIEEINTITHGD